MSGTVNYVDYLFFPNRIQNRLSLFCISKLAVMLVVLARSLNFRCFIWTLEEKVFRSHGSVLMARLNLRCGVANSEPHKLGVVINRLDTRARSEPCFGSLKISLARAGSFFQRAGEVGSARAHQKLGPARAGSRADQLT